MILALLLLSAPVFAAPDADSGAAPRPSEDSIFGSPQPPAQSSSSKSQDSPAHAQRDAFASGEVTDNPLQIGGIYYQQGIASGQSGVSVGNAPISGPLQFDGYLDGRPNDRVRVFVDGRMLYDPTLNAYSNSTNANSFQVQSLQTQSTTSGTSPTGASLTPSNPEVVLDQAWIKFDIDRTVFVTAGKQHVKWGTSKFWNPTDLLSTQKRNPLLPYDLRLGNYMVKFDLPLESKKSSLYALALFDNPQPASTVGQLGGALRGETLIGNTEVGVDFVARGGTTPVYGADVSSPVGPLDVYAEVACLTGSTAIFQPASLPAGTDISTAFSATSLAGPAIQLSGGVSHDFAWEEDRQATLGLELFYNQVGYNNSSAYPALIFTGSYQPFYTGKNYAALYLTAEGPDSLKHTSYSFSTLANLSDLTFISRVDFTWRVLTYLTFAAYLDGHFGAPGGEFNFALSTPALTNAGTPIPAIDLPPTLFDLGLSLRVSI